MAVSFASTNSRLQLTNYVYSGGNDVQTLVCAWYKPDTLTAGRHYFGHGLDWGARVDTTTSEIRLLNNFTTTDAEWVTSGAGIVTGKWQFIACFTTNQDTPAAAWRVWVGDAFTPPREISCSEQVAPVGACGVGGTFYVGNASSLAEGFQGLIAEFSVYRTNAANLERICETLGQISDADAAFVYHHMVCPTWEGRPNTLQAGHRLAASSSRSMEVLYSRLRNADDMYVNLRLSIGDYDKTYSPTAVTSSAESPPRSLMWNPHSFAPYVYYEPTDLSVLAPTLIRPVTMLRTNRASVAGTGTVT